MAGLAIGWSWFGLCAVAFGGLLMRFGAPAKAAVTARPPPVHPGMAAERHPRR
ncbi:MAG: hypothetical protein ACXWYQ_06025 [Actinomycetota bacterium]